MNRLALLLPLALLPAALVSTAAPLPKPSRPAPLDCTGENGVSAVDVKRAQQAWARYLGRKVEEEDEIAPGVKMKFVLVPPGKYVMGSPKGEAGRDKDEVQHEVTITKPFYLGKYTVTQAEYEAVIGKDPSGFKGANLPVEQVSWNDAAAYAKKLSGKKTYRLPTEAEWEYACRGGHPSRMAFGIGDGTSLSSKEANFNGNFPYGGAAKGVDRRKTTAVGTFGANALGLHDMHGNVWQWCCDWYGEYEGKASDPTGPTKGSDRVNRGGSWINYARYCRAAYRSRDEPGYRFNYLGFRLARVPSGSSK